MLLDSDYPDENVRAFATRMLEKVPDGELEDFLLQLTQVSRGRGGGGRGRGGLMLKLGLISTTT